MPDDRRLDTAVITVDGKQVESQLYPRIRLVSVEESVLLADVCTVRIEDAHFELFDQGRFVLGLPLQVAFRAEQAPIEVFDGEITAVALDRGKGGDHELVLTAFDRTHRLTRTPRTRAFQGMTDEAIVKQIADDYGLTPKVEGGGPSYPYILQAGRTDADFLRERAALTGRHFWISGSTLHFAPRPNASATPPKLVYGARGTLRAFRVRFSAADRCDNVVVHGWDGAGKKQITGRSSTVERGTDAPAATRMAEAAEKAFGTVVRETGAHGIATQEQADAWAESLMTRLSGSEVLLQGEAAGDPRLAAGATVRIEGVGTSLTGTYTLTSVVHEIAAGAAYQTRFVSGGRDAAGMLDLMQPPPAMGGSGITSGVGAALVTGQVTSTDDKQKLGRVRVTFPNLAGKDESAWADVVSPGAGKSRGIQWLPEKDDQVLVGFRNGDANKPVVLGGLWSTPDPPPVPDAPKDGRTQTWVLTSRKGHKLALTDDPKSEIVLALGDAGCALTLRADDSSLTGKTKLVISAQEVVVHGDQKLTLSGGEVKVAATGSLTVSGKPVALNPPGS